MNKIPFYIVWQFDPRGNKIGGIGRFVVSIIQQLAITYEVIIVGVTSDRNEVGNKIMLNIQGANVAFIPILAIDEKKKNIIPLSLFFTYKLLLHKKDFLKDGILFLQRVEYLFAFRKNEFYKCVVYHYDISKYLDFRSGESYWSYFPSVYSYINRLLVGKVQKVLSVSSNTVNYFHTGKGFEGVSPVFFPTWANKEIFKLKDNSERALLRSSVLKESGFSSDSRIIIVVGRLNRVKNIKLSIDALQFLPDCYKLIIVGDGDDRFDYENYAKAYGADNNCYFTGNVNQSELAGLYNASDLYLSTSLTEGMSIALLEALACGLPCVTTPTGESHQVINSSNGVVSQSWDSHELSSLIESVYSSFINSSRVEIVNSVKQWDVSESVKKLIF